MAMDGGEVRRVEGAGQKNGVEGKNRLGASR